MTASPEQVFALRRQSHAAADAVEERQSEIGLERQYLSRHRRLAEIEPHRGPPDAAGIGDRYERAKLVEVHIIITALHEY
jgi:hypothetical protein